MCGSQPGEGGGAFPGQQIQGPGPTGSGHGRPLEPSGTLRTCGTFQDVLGPVYTLKLTQDLLVLLGSPPDLSGPSAHPDFEDPQKVQEFRGYPHTCDNRPPELPCLPLNF